MSETNGGNGAAAVADTEAREMRRIRRLLKQMGDIAHDASLTGAFGDGAPEAVQRYNLIVQHLTEQGVVTGPYFPPLPEDADFDRVGVACKLLAGYLEEEEAEQQQGQKGRAVLGGPVNEGGLFIGNLELGDLHLGDLEQLRDLGKLLRENLPALLGNRAPQNTEAAKAEDATAPTAEAAGPSSGGAPLPFPSADLAGAPSEARRP